MTTITTQLTRKTKRGTDGVSLGLLALLLGSGAFASTQTLVIPVQVTVTATGTTVVVSAQSTTIPIPTSPPPPVCGAAPVSTSSPIACPSGTTGSWKQTTTYAQAPYPTCWSASVSPSSAPAGACTPVVTPPTTNNCGMQLGTAAIFCDTFDAPAGTATRSGDLDGNVWGVSRATGAVNFGGQQFDQWASTTIQKCDGSLPAVNSPHDVIICNGQVREASNDNVSGQFENGTVTSLAMYPKQPFDFAGRIGTVSFDVSNDTAGTHSSWPEFWMSDLPVPDPFSHFDTWASLPANGLGVRFGANCDAGQQCICPNANNISKPRWTVDSVAVIRNYVLDDTGGYGPRNVAMKTLDCVVASSGPGNMNHVEVRISQSAIDVYASDAGATTLKHIASASNAGLTFTRGLVWLEDVHYNADKGDSTRPSQREHTFAWDNLAFDGPFTYRDFAFDALDGTTAGPNGSVNLAKLAQPNATSSWNVPGLPANPQATAARVLFNFTGGGDANPAAINVIVNGHTHSVPWPYPDQATNTWRTFAVTVPLTDLLAGINIVQLGASTAQAFANVDIVLVDVTGGVPVLPGSKNTYPGT